MKTLVLQNDFAYLYLNRAFYRKELIMDTFETYKEFLKANIKEMGKYFVVKLNLVDNNFTIEVLSREFLNYLIAKEYETK